MITKEIVEITEELRNIIGKIQGVKNISEAFTVSYIAVVDSEEDKQNVEKVATALEEQAEKYGFSLEVTPVTEKDLEEAREKYEELNKKESVFKTVN